MKYIPSFRPSSDPISQRKPTAAERLSIIIEQIDALNASGELADAPTDLCNILLTDGDNGARELRDWLSGEMVS